MTFDSLISQAASFLPSMKAALGELGTLWKLGEQYIYSHFGTTGVIGTYIVVGALGIAVLAKLIRLAVAALTYLVLPAVATAWIGSMFLPYSFIFLLPLTAAGFSLLFLLKS